MCVREGGNFRSWFFSSTTLVQGIELRSWGLAACVLTCSAILPSPRDSSSQFPAQKHSTELYSGNEKKKKEGSGKDPHSAVWLHWRVGDNDTVNYCPIGSVTGSVYLLVGPTAFHKKMTNHEVQPRRTYSATPYPFCIYFSPYCLSSDNSPLAF